MTSLVIEIKTISILKSSCVSNSVSKLCFYLQLLLQVRAKKTSSPSCYSFSLLFVAVWIVTKCVKGTAAPLPCPRPWSVDMFFTALNWTLHSPVDLALTDKNVPNRIICHWWIDFLMREDVQTGRLRFCLIKEVTAMHICQTRNLKFDPKSISFRKFTAWTK